MYFVKLHRHLMYCMIVNNYLYSDEKRAVYDKYGSQILKEGLIINA